eukprot:CAMPEP_0171252342 /NCGR_PEP_ID=MMETSP0790-20130122/51117_1 /TAXON_ID=2925 /ORGANISM="Alexandrium catenella, Strain OF101" /LENGTH=238 /DNA_ID=CAMNT_0011720091 /DNA_START=64 /DNA_END=777 /DNA_ORIENTATION=-
MRPVGARHAAPFFTPSSAATSSCSPSWTSSCGAASPQGGEVAEEARGAVLAALEREGARLARAVPVAGGTHCGDVRGADQGCPKLPRCVFERHAAAELREDALRVAAPPAAAAALALPAGGALGREGADARRSPGLRQAGCRKLGRLLQHLARAVGALLGLAVHRAFARPDRKGARRELGACLPSMRHAGAEQGLVAAAQMPVSAWPGTPGAPVARSGEVWSSGAIGDSVFGSPRGHL